MSLESLKKQAKNLLRALPEFVQANGSGLHLAQCQELVAQLHGYPSWHAATQRLATPSSGTPDGPRQAADDLIEQANGKTTAPLSGTGMQIVMDGDGPSTRDAMQEYLRERAAQQARRSLAHEEGEPALRRLFEIAHGSHGQCRHVAAFLLGLYNGMRFPFDLTDLRAVDDEIVEDCMRVLRMDVVARQEVHTFFPNGGQQFEALAQLWRIADMRRLKLVTQQILERGTASFGSEEQLHADIRHAMANTWPD